MSATQLSALAAVPAAGAACGSVATMAGGAVGHWGRGRVNKNGWNNEEDDRKWLVGGLEHDFYFP